MTEVLYGVATMVAGLMVGSELAIAAFVHPTLDRLPDDVHLPAASALARVQERIMPFWYRTRGFAYLGRVENAVAPIWTPTNLGRYVRHIVGVRDCIVGHGASAD